MTWRAWTGLGGACVVLATYDADQAGVDGRVYLRSLWQAGGNVRVWTAALVAEQMECS